MHTSNTENREQTFDEKLDAILKAVYGAGRNSRLKLSDSEQLDTWMSVEQAEQAIKTLVLEDVVGEDTETQVTNYGLGRSKLREQQRQIINPQKEGE